jgi:ankyrin repeat protein
MSKSEVIFIDFLRLLPDLTYVDSNQFNILHKIVESFELVYIKEILNIIAKKGQLEQIINQKNNEHETPLHLAVKLERHDVAEILSHHGADKNIVNKDGLVVRCMPMQGGGQKIKITGTRKL